jgi:hypothetical protein
MIEIHKISETILHDYLVEEKESKKNKKIGSFKVCIIG